MFILGVVGSSRNSSTINSISSLLQLKNLKVNIIDSMDNNISTPKHLMDYIEILDKNNSDVLAVNIDVSKIESGFYDFDFDMIVHTTLEKEIYTSDEDIKTVIESEKRIFSKLKPNSSAIINIDDKLYAELLQGANTYLLTYGLNTKSTITASSIDDSDNKLSVCQQRTIKTIGGSEVEPQEFIISIKRYDDHSIYSALATVAVGLLFDVKTEKLSEVLY